MVQQLLPKVASHLGAEGFFNFMVNEKGDALYLHFFTGMPENVARAIQKAHFGNAIGNVEDTKPAAVSELQRFHRPVEGDGARRRFSIVCVSPVDRRRPVAGHAGFCAAFAAAF